jgi:PadR family transcriptional regulator, regulatory protein AphA
MNVRTLVLGILSFGEASGYEIKKMVEDGRFSHFIDASFGSIYPALTALTAENLLTVRAEEQTGRPDKKVYAITANGRASLARALSVTPTKDKFKSEFLFQMLLAEYVSQASLAAAIDKQIGDLKEDLARIAECDADISGQPGCGFVHGYANAVLNAGVKYLEERRSAFLEPRVLKAAE